MLSSGDTKELVILRAVEFLIISCFDRNDIEFKCFEPFYNDINKFVDRFTKDINKKQFKTKIDKIFNILFNINKNSKNDIKISISYLICFLLITRFQPNNRNFVKLNPEIEAFFKKWENYLETGLFDLGDSTEEEVIVNTENLAYKLLDTLN